MNNYFELKISINPNIEEILADFFFTNFDCEGVVLAEESYKDLEMTSTTRGTLKVFLTTFPANLNELLQTEREILKSRGFTDEELGSWKIELDEKENQDWSKKWKEKWTITHVTDRIAVVPSWLSYTPKENEVTITLDPGCAFGTGTHQTTQLCMKAIEKYMPANAKMADIGTGSGILAILAKKFGASSVYGCDNDETVIDVCYENARKNGLLIQSSAPLAGEAAQSAKGGYSSHRYYAPYIKTFARSMRKEMTLQEVKLWQLIRKNQLGVKFRRQLAIDNQYIADFACIEKRLIIEIDGGQHNQSLDDSKRSLYLNKQNFRVVRFWNNEIDNNIEGCIEFLKRELRIPPTALRATSPARGAEVVVDSTFVSLPARGAEVLFELKTADKLTEKYDFVCANILHNVLAEIMGDLKNIMAPNAKMVLSGILDEKKPVVLEAIEKNGLEIIEEMHQDQWIAFVVE